MASPGYSGSSQPTWSGAQSQGAFGSPGAQSQGAFGSFFGSPGATWTGAQSQGAATGQAATGIPTGQGTAPGASIAGWLGGRGLTVIVGILMIAGGLYALANSSMIGELKRVATT